MPTFPAIPLDAAKDFTGKTIIIGAGVAGLFAANTLKYMGVDDYIVLEASDTFGGRLKTTYDFHHEVPLELGAEWIHASTEDVVNDMLVFPAEEGLEPSEFIRYQPEWYFSSGKSRMLGCVYQETKWKRLSYHQWLDKYVYQHVQDKVEFNAIVKQITYSEREVKLVMADGTEHRADKVICTVPLGVLKKEGALTFEPPLPKKMQEAIDEALFPAGMRILYEMKEKFYPDVTSSGGLTELLLDPDNVQFTYDPLFGKDQLSGKQNILAFVAVGDKYGGELGKLEDEELAKAALAKIDEMFDGQGTKNYIKHVVQNWTREPFVFGAYTMALEKHHREAMGKTLQGNLIFAGEHTSEYNSLVPGAALSGRRAAVEAVSGRII